jgi:hypothetical protein
LATKRKKTSGSPVPKTQRQLLAARFYKRLTEGVLLTRDLQDHINPMGECLITLEQWRYLRGSIAADLALYAQLEGKPSPIDIIVKNEQERVLIDF